MLASTFNASDVKQALDEIDSNKAPSPDGFTVAFFSHNWDIIGSDIEVAVLSFLNCQESLGALNHTDIILIPKIEDPRYVKDYRPIALCNVLYKLISKILANRMKCCLQ